MADIQAALSHYQGVKPENGKPGHYMAFSPLRSEKKRSVSIKDETREKDRILIHDYGDPTVKGVDIHRAAGGELEEILPEREKKPLQKWQTNLEDEYRYADENGSYLYSKLRYKGKVIRYARISGDHYEKGKGDAEGTLFNLPDLLKAIRKSKTVYIVEGEKDVRTMTRMGLTATTAGSVGDWRSSYAEYFKGADVVILADNDQPGKDLARRISNDLKEIAYCRRIITPSDQDHGDITDFIEGGGTKAELLKMVSDTEPEYATWIQHDGKKVKVNCSLLADSVMKNVPAMNAMNPGTNSELFFVYEGGKYTRKSDGEIIAMVRPYLPAAIATPITLKNTSQMIKYNAPSISFDELNSDEHFINGQNGLYEIRTGKVVPHTSRILSTVQLASSFVEHANTPAWDQFILELCSDENGKLDLQMTDVLQEWLGLMLSPLYGYRLKKALVMYSAQGNTGKSVLMNVITGILGPGSYANISFQELGSSRWATGRAFGKRLIAVGDQGSESIPNSTTFKAMTGGDVIGAELKGKDGFDYVFRGVIVIACNALPVFEDDKGQHMAERLTFLNCRNTIDQDQRDPLLTDKLLKEKDGILTWAIEGLQRFLRNGWRFSQCDSSDDLMVEYRKRYDTLYSFLMDKCIITMDRSDSIRKTALEDRYESYCAEMEYMPLSRRNIEHRAASLGIVTSIKDGFKVYRGVKFNDVELWK